jgi:hypothetical protein
MTWASSFATSMPTIGKQTFTRSSRRRGAPGVLTSRSNRRRRQALYQTVQQRLDLGIDPVQILEQNQEGLKHFGFVWQVDSFSG